MDSAIVRALNLVDKVLNYIEVSVLVVTGVLLLGSLFYAALVRYAHLGSFPEETEFSWLLYSWMVFIGGSSVLRKGDHPHVSVIRKRFGWRYKVALYVISVVYLSGLVYALVSYRWLYAAQKTAVMRLSLTYFYGAALVGLSFMVVRYVIKILNLVRTKGGSEAP